MKYVKIMSIPGACADIECEEDANINTIAQSAGMSLAGMNITCTDPKSGANARTIPANGAQIVLTRQVKGA